MSAGYFFPFEQLAGGGLVFSLERSIQMGWFRCSFFMFFFWVFFLGNDPQELSATPRSLLPTPRLFFLCVGSLTTPTDFPNGSG